jgi:hypothetical protein
MKRVAVGMLAALLGVIVSFSAVSGVFTYSGAALWTRPNGDQIYGIFKGDGNWVSEQIHLSKSSAGWENAPALRERWN